MKIEVTGEICDGRCEVQTKWCRARACGAVCIVLTPEKTQIRVCGACLSEMSDLGRWYLPGTRPTPWPLQRHQEGANPYTPSAGALPVEPAPIISRGRCELKTEVCEAREWGVLTLVTLPDCRDVKLCGACLEHMVVSGVWDLGRSGGAAVAEIKRLTQFEAAAPAA